MVKQDATGAAEPGMLLAGRASRLMANFPVRICDFRGKCGSVDEHGGMGLRPGQQGDHGAWLNICSGKCELNYS